MQLDDKYIDKPDDFSRKAGEKLRNHRMPVDPDVWNTLKDKLPRERRISAYWPWAAAAVVALALVWLFLPAPPADDPLLTEHSQLEKPIKPEAVVPEMNADGTESRTENWTESRTENWTESRTERKADIKQVVKENGAKPEKTEEPVETSGPEKAAKPEERMDPEKTSELKRISNHTDRVQSAEITELTGISKPGETTGSEEITKPGEIVTQEKIPALEETTGLAKAAKPEERMDPEKTSEPKGISKHTDRVQSETAKPEKTPRPEESVKPGMKVLPVEELLAENDLPLPVQERRGLRSLMAALGSGGLPLDFSFGSYDADNPSYSDTFPGGELNNGDGLGSGNKYNVLKPGDYTDIEHRPPVSFSLTAGFPIGKDVSMETGLSYTYLFSRFRRNDDFIYRGTLRQHYIGIPVNLRYVVWQNDAWNVYLLGGGSIEKGLRSIYKQEIEQNGGVVDHANVYSGIDGFQFSAQGGAGFSYRLQGNLSLFGEPRIIYYFRNNQPMSARTENPLIFGLNMGIRLRFK